MAWVYNNTNDKEEDKNDNSISNNVSSNDSHEGDDDNNSNYNPMAGHNSGNDDADNGEEDTHKEPSDAPPLDPGTSPKDIHDETPANDEPQQWHWSITTTCQHTLTRNIIKEEATASHYYPTKPLNLNLNMSTNSNINLTLMKKGPLKMTAGENQLGKQWTEITNHGPPPRSAFYATISNLTLADANLTRSTYGTRPHPNRWHLNKVCQNSKKASWHSTVWEGGYRSMTRGVRVLSFKRWSNYIWWRPYSPKEGCHVSKKRAPSSTWCTPKRRGIDTAKNKDADMEESRARPPTLKIMTCAYTQVVLQQWKRAVFTV